MGVFCGVDIVEIDRIKKSFDTTGTAFRDRLFSQNEINYCESKKASRFQSYAARFAAKEAVSKAIGTGFANGVSWKDIETLNDQSGRPYIVLSGKAKALFEDMKGLCISLSLSHCENYAVANVVIQTKDE